MGRLPQTPGYGTELAWHTKFYAARSKAWIALAPVVKYTLLTSVTICTVGVVSEELTLLKDSVIEAGPLDKELLVRQLTHLPSASRPLQHSLQLVGSLCQVAGPVP